MPSPMRLQELHPSLVHYPIALLPVALGADALGRATGNRSLLAAGKVGMALSAVGAAVSVATGLLAQQSVNLDEHTTDMLITHRDLNVGLLGLTTAMAIGRARRKRPSLAYLAAGAAGVGTMLYSAYLGGAMVYHHGVGVEAAGGLRKEAAPELTPDNVGEVARTSAKHAREGLQVFAKEVSEGKVAPLLTGRS